MNRLVKYKNLSNHKLTEEQTLFIDQLHTEFDDIDMSFIKAVVKCFYNAILKDNKLRIMEIGDDSDESTKLNVINFFSEIKEYSQNLDHTPSINLDLNGPFGENLNFLLNIPKNPSQESLEKFARYYSANVPDISFPRITELVSFVFDNIREATELGLNGEKVQTEKERWAEEAWSKSCAQPLYISDLYKPKKNADFKQSDDNVTHKKHCVSFS